MLHQQQQHHQFPGPSSLSSPSNPSSPTFPHSTSLSLNGAGYTLAIRPGTALGPGGSTPTTTTDSHPHSSSSSSPHSASYHSYVKSWDSNQVSRWLEDSGVPQHADTFRNNDITGSVLLDVDQAALKEMGVRSVGDRVRIAVAIKALRQKCVAAALVERASAASASTINGGGGTGSRPSTATSTNSNGTINGYHSPSNGRPLSPSRTSRSQSPSQPQSTASSSTISRHGSLSRRPGSSNSNTTALSSSTTTNSRHSGRIPPPLHLTQSNAHPSSSSSSSLAEAYQPLPTPTPRAPAPTSALPLPPPSTSSSLPTNTRSGSIPTLTTPSTLPVGRSPNPSPTPNPSTISSRPPQGAPPLRPSTAVPQSSIPQSNLRKPSNTPSSSSRPATANASTSSSSSSTPYTHPYAASSTIGPGNISPTRAELLTYSITRATTPNPLQPSSTPRLLPSPHIAPLSSSPPADSLIAPTTPSLPSSHGFSVGRGPFARPTTPGGLVSASGPIPNSGSGHHPHQSLDAVLRKAVKFILGEVEGGSKMVVVNDCEGGKEVLGRVLRKFGKEDEGGSWGVWATGETGALRLLTESELFTICQDASSPERQRGLTLRRIHPLTPSSAGNKRGRKLQWMFGDPTASESSSSRPGGVSSSPPRSPASPSSLEVPGMAVEPASPDGSTEREGEYQRQQEKSARERTKLNRASVISVMSALNAGGDWSPTSPNLRDDRRTSEYSTRSPPAASGSGSQGGAGGSFLSPGKRRFRNFFGQRPPSEMIATHLTDYFPLPKAEKKLLSKQVRESMRRSVVRRDSQYSVISSAGSGGGGSGGTSWEKSGGELSRYSGSSMGSGGIGGPPPPDKDYPPTPRISQESTSANTSGGAGFLEPPEENHDGDVRRASIASSRYSGLSGGGWGRGGGSDSASMVTVEEVTAVLEERRASMYGDGDEGVFEEDEREGLEGDSSEEESDDEEEDPIEAQKPAETSKPQFKWVKGALIGSGSFGSVYLGMNPMSGSLMAVKQVELPTGNSHNEERKKSMLEALEREIELLKVLQHENIVQYLDSSSDATHLNIFLEYVPGGSVAALLSNYGAFEEALVSKFVRQILTGLDYLHEREIIHRDIKGANILVDNKGGIKISDFGISKRVEDNLLTGSKVHRPSLQGSVYWMAPEVVKQEAYTSKADLWSLGCLVVEMLTGSHPWAKLTQMQAIFRIGSQSRPEIPDDITPEADDFLDKTFMIEYNERPSARDLLVHPFIRDFDAIRAAAEQQTPTRATFSQNNSPVKEGSS